MTTTAHEDQFTAEPEHVTHRPYDTAAILRQNVADLERELQRQRERADMAESELDAERKRLDWALEMASTFYEWQGKHYLSYDVPEHDGFDVLETDNPRSTIDELIAGENK